MGIAGKVRPCLLLTDYPADDELALITVLPAHHRLAWQSLGAGNFQAVSETGRVPSPANPVGERRLSAAEAGRVDGRRMASRPRRAGQETFDLNRGFFQVADFHFFTKTNQSDSYEQT
jgi:hypothetical protein